MMGAEFTFRKADLLSHRMFRRQSEKMQITDIHCHILPGIDDGALNPTMSMKMASIASKCGVRTIVATSHSSREPADNHLACEMILKGVSQMRNALKKAGIPLELLPGMELMANDFLDEILFNKDYLTINGSRYLLIEFDFFETPEFIGRSLESVLDAGLIPLIAHPERYKAVSEKDIERWLGLGCITQINAGSLIGVFGTDAKDKAERYINAGLIHIAASDAHRDSVRSTNFEHTSEKLIRLAGHDRAELLLDINPKAIVKNSPTVLL